MYQKSEKVNIVYQLLGGFKHHENIKQTGIYSWTTQFVFLFRNSMNHF